MTDGRWTVRFAARAERDMRRLDRRSAPACTKRSSDSVTSPHACALRKLSGRPESRLRVGDSDFERLNRGARAGRARRGGADHLHQARAASGPRLPRLSPPRRSARPVWFRPSRTGRSSAPHSASSARQERRPRRRETTSRAARTARALPRGAGGGARGRSCPVSGSRCARR